MRRSVLAMQGDEDSARRCAECGAVADERAEGWRTYLTEDDETAVYCPACAAREFGEP
jgi:hypothetical protein